MSVGISKCITVLNFLSNKFKEEKIISVFYVSYLTVIIYDLSVSELKL